MTWTKIGDELPDDAADLSDAAFRTHVEALAWSNRRLLDLRVPKRDLRRFAFSSTAELAAAELTDAGWWQDCGDAWVLAHRPEWQQSRDQVETRRLTNLRAQRHRRGLHDLCDPTKCPALCTSADDTPDDSSGDPGRAGTVRDRLLEERPPTNAPRANVFGVGKCDLCTAYERLNDFDVCARCASSEIAGAS